MTYKHFTVVFNDEPLESATRWSQAFDVYVDGKLIYEHKLEPTRVFEGVVTSLQISTPENAAIEAMRIETKEKAAQVCEKALITAEKKLREYAESEEGEYNLGRSDAELELAKAWPEEVYVVREAIAAIRSMK